MIKERFGIQKNNIALKYDGWNRKGDFKLNR